MGLGFATSHQPHKKSLRVAGSFPRDVGVSGGADLLAPSWIPPSPRSTEASPELHARILESLIMASEAAEVPAAPGKRCPAGGRGGAAGVKFGEAIAAGRGAVSVAGAVMGRCPHVCGGARAVLAPWPGTLFPFPSLLSPQRDWFGGISLQPLRRFAAVFLLNVCVTALWSWCGASGSRSPILGAR